MSGRAILEKLPLTKVSTRVQHASLCSGHGGNAGAHGLQPLQNQACRNFVGRSSDAPIALPVRRRPPACDCRNPALRNGIPIG